MPNNLEGCRVAILIENGFEEVEMTEPRDALEAAGAKTTIISPAGNKVTGWNLKDWGDEFKVETALDSADPDGFDALLLPGGVINPDKLRMNPKAVEFVRAFVDAHKPIASICHGPWTLVEADAVRGRTLTSWPSLKTDIINAGGTWVDREVVRDEDLVTSRKPDDIPAFNREMIRVFAESRTAKPRSGRAG